MKAHVAVGAAAILFVPVDEVRPGAEAVRFAFEVLPVVNERAAGVRHHHVAVVQILAGELEAHVARLDDLMMRRRVVGVDVDVGRPEALPASCESSAPAAASLPRACPASSARRSEVSRYS